MVYRGKRGLKKADGSCKRLVNQKHRVWVIIGGTGSQPSMEAHDPCSDRGRSGND